MPRDTILEERGYKVPVYSTVLEEWCTISIGHQWFGKPDRVLMNEEIMALILTIIGNGVGSLIDNFEEIEDEEKKERLNHLWTICNHNLGLLVES